MESVKIPSFSVSLSKKISKAFNALAPQDGKITKEQFATYIVKSIGVPSCPPQFTEAFDNFDLDKDGFINEAEFKYALGHVQNLKFDKFLPGSSTATLQGAEGEAMKKLEHLKTKDYVETSHKIDLRVGDTSTIKTKLEFKYLIHGSDETKHYTHISKNLHFSEESVGVIIRIHANDPRAAQEKIQGLLDNALEMASALLPPDSVPAKILNAIDIEVTNDDAVVSIGIRVKEDCDNFFVLATLVTFEQYYHHFQQYLHVGVELKHDLHSLFGEPRKLTTLLTDGLWIFAHLKTNYNEFYKTYLTKLAEKAPSFAPINAAVQLFLQKNFNLQLNLPEINIADICGTNCCGDALQMDTSIVGMMLPMVTGPVTPMIQNPPNEMATTAVDLFKDNLRCNFSFSIKMAEAIFTTHFKTSGLKEIFAPSQ
jgi:hypothetical protein